MECSAEPLNRFDQYAVVVKAPTTTVSSILGLETRPGQHVKDILGTTVGHVPKHICNLLSIRLRNGTLRKATCFLQGK